MKYVKLIRSACTMKLDTQAVSYRSVLTGFIFQILPAMCSETSTLQKFSPERWHHCAEAAFSLDYDGNVIALLFKNLYLVLWPYGSKCDLYSLSEIFQIISVKEPQCIVSKCFSLSPRSLEKPPSPCQDRDVLGYFFGKMQLHNLALHLELVSQNSRSRKTPNKHSK